MQKVWCHRYDNWSVIAKHSDLAENVIAECLVTTPKRSIELRHDGNAEGQWDPVRIEQIVSNLVGNAIRHGSESAPIVVIVNEAEGSALLSIHNDGAIDADVRQMHAPIGNRNRLPVHGVLELAVNLLQ